MVKNKQRGFTWPLALVVVAVILVGAGLYAYTRTKQSNQPVPESPITQATTTTPVSNPVTPAEITQAPTPIKTPTVQPPSIKPPTITTTSLPPATVGIEYSNSGASLSSVGGTGIRGWRVTEGDLPPGILLNSIGCPNSTVRSDCSQPATISLFGVPETAGSYAFMVTVTVGTQSASKKFTIVVNQTNVIPTLTAISPTSGPVGTFVSVTGAGFDKFSFGGTVADRRDYGNTVAKGTGFFVPGFLCPTSDHYDPLCTVGTKVTPGVYDVQVVNANGRSRTIPFTVTEKPSVTVLSPNGNEVWSIGSTHLIQWTSANLPKQAGGAELAVFIEIRNVNGGYVEYITRRVANSGSYPWTVAVQPGDYEISVTALDISDAFTGLPTSAMSFADTSDAPFTVASTTP